MEANEWTIPDLLQLSGGYWSSCTLHAGVKLDIFTALDDAALTAEDVAQLLKTAPRSTGMLLDALAALGLMEKKGNTFTATPIAAQTLSKKSPEYLGHIILHHHHLMSGWTCLDQAVTSGAPIRKLSSQDDDVCARESFLMGMFNLANQLAPRIAQSLRLSGWRRLLDLGGGPGTYAIHFCLANPELSAVVFDLPTTRPFAESTIASFDLTQRIDFVSGDYHVDPLPSGFDAAWLSHILHSDGPAACAQLLRKAVSSLNSGGVLMVQEFILDDDRTSPPFPALFSLNMLLGTVAGQSYSENELVTMMTEAGLSDVHRIILKLPNGAGLMRGRKV